MPILEHLYTATLWALQGAFPLLARGDGKVARGIRGRRGVEQEMVCWAEAHRDPRRALVWFHAPSVGEGLQARAVMERVRERRPDAQVVYTFFSPSAETFARSVPADRAGYLPLDLPGPLARVLEAVRPDLVAFSKTDVWPNLTRGARDRGVPLALLSATLPAGSTRLRGPARALLGATYRRLDRVAAISAADAERFTLLGVRRERCTVMGDAHFDRVLRRADTVDRESPLLRALGRSGALTIVAGSTWAADEGLLLPALRRIAGGAAARLVLVPHEPTPEHLAESEARLDVLGLRHRRLGALEDGWAEGEVLLVDRVGVLGDLYALADVAYVGGGWGRAGLHSVLEPAAYGLPIVFGPHHANAREAGELAAAGAAFSVASGAELQERLGRLLGDTPDRARAGEAARAYVEAGAGAAERGADVVDELLRLRGQGC